MKFYHKEFKAIKKEKKIRTNYIAGQMGVTTKTIWSWENAHSVPILRDIKLLSQILEVNTSQISDYKEITEISDILRSSKNQLLLENIKHIDKALNNIKHLAEFETFNDLKSRYIEYRLENRILKNRADKFEGIVNSLSPLVYIKNSNRQFKFVNNSYIRHTGIIREEIINFNNSDIFGLKEIHEIAEYEKVAFEQKEKISNKKITIPRSGRIGLLSIVPNYDKNNKVIEIVCSIKDITDISTANKRREQLETAVNKLSETIWIKSLAEKEKYIFMGGGCEKISGIPQDDFYKTPEGWKTLVLKEDLKLFKYDKDTNFISEGEYLVRIRNTKKEVRYVSVKVFRTKDADGNPLYYGIDKDVTEDYENNIINTTMVKALEKSSMSFWLGTFTEGKEKISKNLKYTKVTKNLENIHCVNLDLLNADCRNWLNSVYSKDINKVNKFIFSTGITNSKSIVYRVVMEDNSLKWVSSTIYKLAEDIYFGTIVDITKQKDLERRNKAALITLHVAEDSVWLTRENQDGIVETIFSNKARSLLYNTTKSRIQNNEYFWKDYIHPQDRKRVLAKVLSGNKIQYRIIVDGQIKHIEETIFNKTIFEIKYKGGILRDVTERYEIKKGREK